jgi:hypothetical protein
MDWFAELLYKTLLVLFAVGVAGCIFVIPVTALELFRTLLEPDTEAERQGIAPESLAQP